MKAFMTKYAMTIGIQEVETQETSIPGLSRVKFHFGTIPVKFIHSTEESARCHAKEMQAARIESLRRQIAKTEKIDFDTKPITKF